MKLDPYHTTYFKMNKKWTRDLNMKAYYQTSIG